MINYLSCSIADYFYLNKIIEEHEKDIYIYGLRLMISTIVSILSIIIISLVINQRLLTSVFLIVFITIRRYSGGYHANSYSKCTLTFISLYLIAISIILFTPENYIMTVSLGAIASTVIIFFKYVPIDNENKRLSMDIKAKNKRISLFLLFTFYILAMSTIGINIRIFYTVTITLFMVSVLILIQTKKEGKP